MTADAGLVPCALVGIKHTFLLSSPRLLWYSCIANRPAYSPCEPAFGCKDISANPVISHNHSFKSNMILWYPRVCSSGTNGCIFAISFQLTGINSDAAFNFIVQLPRGIIPFTSEKSFDPNS